MCIYNVGLEHAPLAMVFLPYRGEEPLPAGVGNGDVGEEVVVVVWDEG